MRSQVSLRITEKFRNRLEKVAERSGLNKSSIIRRGTLKEINDIEKEVGRESDGF